MNHPELSLKIKFVSYDELFSKALQSNQFAHWWVTQIDCQQKSCWCLCSWCELEEFVVTLHVHTHLTSNLVNLLWAIISIELIHLEESLIALKVKQWAGIIEIEVERSHDFAFQIDQILYGNDVLLWLSQQEDHVWKLRNDGLFYFRSHKKRDSCQLDQVRCVLFVLSAM